MVEIGLERCVADPPGVMRGVRLGLVMNHASLDRECRFACDVLAERFPGQLRAIFTPQHGFWGEAQANMIETPHTFHARLGVPIYSLYSATRRPSPDMLRGIDCLVVDLQDVGTRVYTFVWTMLYCLEECGKLGMPVVVLDRPNPLGGEVVEGPVVDTAFRSFVGAAAVPLRHGLTIGELALLLNRELALGCRVEVVAMAGWCRAMLWPETGRVWAPPSPNMPRFETALAYSGMVLLEGTNLSEGRGTTRPFEMFGAPFVDPDALVARLRSYPMTGIKAVPTRFRPTFDKWQGAVCGGAALHIVDSRRVRAIEVAVAILACARSLWPRDFAWRSPPYEYEHKRTPVDLLFGSSRLRERLADPADFDAAESSRLARADEANWERRVRPCLLYG
jgi:uncharacterized protein YbbC (DUF1343 family)